MAKGIQIHTLQITDKTVKMSDPDFLALIDQLVFDTGSRAIAMYGEEYLISNSEIIAEAIAVGAIDETTQEAIINNIAISFIDPSIRTASEIFAYWQGLQQQKAKWFELYPVGGVKSPVVVGELTTYLNNWIQGAQITKIKHISKL